MCLLWDPCWGVEQGRPTLSNWPAPTKLNHGLQKVQLENTPPKCCTVPSWARVGGKAARTVGLISSQSGPACGGIWAVTATWRLGWPTGGRGRAFGILCGKWHLPVCGEWRSDGVSMGPVSLLFHSALCCRTAWADWALAEVNEHDSHHLWGVGKSHVLHQLLFKAPDFFFCLHTGTRASTQSSLSWRAWQSAPGLADLMKSSKVICTSSIPLLGWLLSWEEKGLEGRKTSGSGGLLSFIP